MSLPGLAPPGSRPTMAARKPLGQDAGADPGVVFVLRLEAILSLQMHGQSPDLIPKRRQRRDAKLLRLARGYFPTLSLMSQCQLPPATSLSR